MNYGVAAVVTSLMVLLRWVLDPVMENRLVLATLYGAVAVAVWCGGWGPAVLATLGGYVACEYLFMEPRGRLTINDQSGLLGLGLYLVSCALIITLGHGMRSTRSRLEASLAQLKRETAERLAAEQRSGPLLKRLTALVDNTPLAVVEWDRDFVITRWSGLAERVFGWTAAEVVGRRIDSFPLIYPEDVPAAQETMRRLQDPANSFVVSQNRNMTRSGRVILCEWYNSIIHDDSGEMVAVLSMVLDVTHREEAGAAVRASEAEFRSFFELGAFGAGQTDPRTGRFVAVNDRFCEITGYNRDELLTMTARDLTHPEDRARDDELYRRMLRGETAEYRNEKRYVRRDGLVIWVYAASRVLRDESGASVRTAGIVIDITERRLAQERLLEHRDHLDRLVRERTEELERSHEALSLAERMAAMGTLAAGLGHDMNNIILPMRLWLDVLDEAPLPVDAKQSVRSLRRSTDYLRSLALGLRALSLDPDDGANAPARTTLAEWWDEVRGLYRGPLPKGVQLHDSGFQDLPATTVPAHALTQIVFNLIQNAGDAMRDRALGNIWVSAELGEDAIRLTVRDDGPGMSPEVRARCIEPFFTTKPRGRGTGLGLSIVHGTLERYGGRLEVRSEPGQGAAFTMILPIARSEAAAGRAAAVTVRDPRTDALVRAVVTGMGLKLQPISKGSFPAADVWVADESVASDELRRFIAGGGRVVSLAERPELAGVVEMVPDRRPAGLREAVARAASGN